jgi:hypothetical protein
MGDIKTAADLAFDDYETSGVPSSGAKDPPKDEVRAVFDIIDDRINGKQTRPCRAVTAAGAIAMAASDHEIIVNKTVGAATAVTLPPAPTLGQVVIVSDGKGDAGTNTITITAASGTINGAANVTIHVNWGAVKLRYSGTQWNTTY